MVCPSFGDAPVLSGTRLSSQTIAYEEIIPRGACRAKDLICLGRRFFSVLSVIAGPLVRPRVRMPVAPAWVRAVGRAQQSLW
jgi:hypothetical protein